MIEDLIRQVNRLQQQVDGLVMPEVSSAGGGAAAGNDTEIQWNNAGAFGASPNFTFDDATNIVSILSDGGSLIITQDAVAGALPSLTLRNDDVSEPLISISSDAGDQDLVFAELTGITGTPTILWDESEDVWLFTPGISSPVIVAPGADTQIIFNDAGNLGADANFTWDDATGLMSVIGDGGRISIIQDAVAGAVPSLTLRQDDVSEPLISIASDAGDQDLVLLALTGITGVPTLSWDESETSFDINLNLTVSGTLFVAQNIEHEGDADTLVQFTDDKIILQAGGLTFLDLTEAASDVLTVNINNDDIDFVIDGDNSAAIFKTDAGLDAVQLTPAGTRASGAGATWDGVDLLATTATITGAVNITNATGFNFFDIKQPTLSAAAALTVTNSATVRIADAPTGSGAGPATITNAYALWIDGGESRFDGQVTFNGLVSSPGNDTEIIFNDAGNLGANGNFTWDDATGLLSVIGDGGRISVIQDSAAGAVPSLTLRQDDISEPLISISSDAGDQDLVVMELTGITGTPTILWDESENEWLFSPGINATSIAAPGNDTEIIVNTAGSLGTDSNFTYDDASGIMSVLGDGGSLIITQDAAAGAVPSLTLRNDDVSEPLISISSDAGDQDLVLMRLDGITGIPAQGWDESQDAFDQDKGLRITSGGLAIGTSELPEGGTGNARLGIEGTNASAAAGPHVQFTTASDDFPLLQILPFTHDNILMIFDGYFDGAFRSSDAGSTFAIRKLSDQLQFLGATGVPPGNPITFATSFVLTVNPIRIGMGTVAPLARFDIVQTSATAAVPVLRLEQRDVSEEFVNFTISGDQDMVLMKLSVTGNPTINWDESEDDFSFSHGIITTEVGIGTAAAPDELLHVKGASDPIIWLEDTGSAIGAITRTMAGIQLSAGTHELEAGIGPGIKFMSTDAQLTTENPKLGAVIVGQATETYNADTSGGMSIGFYVTDNAPGANNVPVQAMNLRGNGRLGVTNGSLSLTAIGDFVQDSTTEAIPVLSLKQDDVSEEFMFFQGSAAAATLTQSIVAEADVTTATSAGFLKVEVQDDGNQIADQAYFVRVWTLA